MSSEPDTLKNFKEFEKNSQLPEHFEEKPDSGSFGATDGDEALQLVGAEAKEHFSDEFNRKLRRKLVRALNVGCGLLPTMYCCNVGLCHPNDIRSNILHPIPVRPTARFLSRNHSHAYV